jgi:hypothetical protein
MNYVRNHGYRVGLKVLEACSYRHVGPAAHPLCQGDFVRKSQGR